MTDLNRINNAVVRPEDVTIASGTTSDAIDLSGFTLAGITTPASLASTSMSFTVAPVSGGTYSALKDRTNTTYTITVSNAAAYYPLDPALFAGVRFVKIVMGSSETAKTFYLHVRPIS